MEILVKSYKHLYTLLVVYYSIIHFLLDLLMSIKIHKSNSYYNLHSTEQQANFTELYSCVIQMSSRRKVSILL